jgi:hypothetical protein
MRAIILEKKDEKKITLTKNSIYFVVLSSAQRF